MKHEILIYNKNRRQIPEKLVKSVILRTLKFLQIKQPVELAVLFVSPSEIKRLNKIWRHKNYTPDELSFGLNSRQTAKLAKSKNKVLELGEIVINVDKISDKNYLTAIIAHSLLHLLGYHHEKSVVESKKIERLEERILKYLKI